MKKKTVFLLAFVLFTIVAIYAVWHYSPLRYISQSKSTSGETKIAALGENNQPVVVRKKIPPRSEATALEKDLPRPLIVLKDQVPKPAPKIDGPQKSTAETAAKDNKVLVLQPDGTLQAAEQAAPEGQADKDSKTIARKPESTALKKKSAQPYSILLASCRLPQSARKVISDYQKAGLSPYVAKVEFKNGEVWLRVFAGQYETHNEALKVKKDHQLSGALIKKTPYTNLIDTFASQAAMKDSLKRLEDLGYSPYVLETAPNQFQLVVGAFITREGAEKQKSELQSKGIPSKIIER